MNRMSLVFLAPHTTKPSPPSVVQFVPRVSSCHKMGFSQKKREASQASKGTAPALIR